jgi:hypothetical protein
MQTIHIPASSYIGYSIKPQESYYEASNSMNENFFHNNTIQSHENEIPNPNKDPNKESNDVNQNSSSYEKYVWIFSIFLLVLAGSYLFILHYVMDIPYNEESDITIQYASEEMEKIKMN